MHTSDIVDYFLGGETLAQQRRQPLDAKLLRLPAGHITRASRRCSVTYCSALVRKDAAVYTFDDKSQIPLR